MNFNIEKFGAVAADLRDIVSDSSASPAVVQSACSVLANLLAQVPRTEEGAAAKFVTDLGFKVVRTGWAVRVDAPANLDPGWTIVLIPPDYLSSGDDDVYIEQVDEAKLSKALKVARHNAFVVSIGRMPLKSEMKDFRLVAAIRGSHNVISGDL